MNVKRGFENRWAMLSGVPVRKLSMQMTSAPSPRNRSQRCEPMNPAPPVINTRDTPLPLSLAPYGHAPDGQVGEAMLPHDLRVVEVAAVDDERALQQLLHACEIGTAELVPVRDHEERVRAVERVVVDAVIGD